MTIRIVRPLGTRISNPVTQTRKKKGKGKKENDAAFPNADAPTAIPLELTIGQACSLPHREGVLRCVQENKLRSLRLPISSLDQPATYRAISHSPHLLTGTPKKVSNADKMSHRGTKGQENGSGG